MTSDASIDTSYDGRWLTYQELAEVRRISKTSAIRLVMRHRWRRQRDNQGGARILVPTDMLAPDRPSHDTPDDAPSDTSSALETALTAIEAAHATEVAALRAQADVSEQGRIAMQELADRAMAQLADAGERADRAEARAADAETRARDATEAARRVRESLEALTREDDARKARGRWARLRAAWRGE